MKHTSQYLVVLMYHYIRAFSRCAFPRLKGVEIDDFAVDISSLRTHYEMATVEAALDFLQGRYQPSRPLCLLTFDDGLKEHYTDVAPRLEQLGIPGIFLLATSCFEGRVLGVHKNHFLLASLGFEVHKQKFLARLGEIDPTTRYEADYLRARHVYRWDTPEVSAFKHLLNFQLSEKIRDAVLDSLFEECLGNEAEFARQLYLTWDEACQMQRAGMVMGAHTHRHAALDRLEPDDVRADLGVCAHLLRSHLGPQRLWPFSYPYGHVSAVAVQTLRDLEFDCAFTTEVGHNDVHQDRYRLRRIDPKDLRTYLSMPATAIQPRAVAPSA